MKNFTNKKNLIWIYDKILSYFEVYIERYNKKDNIF